MSDRNTGKLPPGKAFDHDKVLTAINRTIDLFSEMKLTVAETVHVAAVLNETVKANYPEVYKLMTSGGFVSLDESEG